MSYLILPFLVTVLSCDVLRCLVAFLCCLVASSRLFASCYVSHLDLSYAVVSATCRTFLVRLQHKLGLGDATDPDNTKVMVMNRVGLGSCIG